MGEPRVLHVVTDSDRRGAQLAGAMLHEQLADRGWASRMVALAPGERGDLPIPYLSRHAKSPSTVLALRRQLEGVDVVVAHGSTTLPISALATPGSAPFIYVNIGDPRGWLTTPARLWRTRAALSRAASVAAVSPASAPILRDWLRVPEERIHVVPNSRDPAVYRPLEPAERASARTRLGLPETGQVILWMGALSPEKRPDLALRVARDLPDALVVMAGDGPLAASLTQPAEDAGVLLAGAVSDPALWMGAADALLLTSDTEGVPGVLIEAGLCGLPSVSTDAGFVSDVVLDGRTGRLVPRGDADALARAVGECLSAREEWGAAAREHCRGTFGTDVVVPRWEALLRAVAEGRR